MLSGRFSGGLALNSGTSLRQSAAAQIHLHLMAPAHVSRERTFLPCRRLSFLKALGPLTVCIISIVLMNIFKWYDDTTGLDITSGGKTKAQPLIAQIGKIPKGEAPCCAVLCSMGAEIRRDHGSQPRVWAAAGICMLHGVGQLHLALQAGLATCALPHPPALLSDALSPTCS